MLMNPIEWVDDVIVEKGKNMKIAENGVDLTLAKVYRIVGPTEIYEDKSKIKWAKKYEITPENGMWFLDPGFYEFWFNEYVKIPANKAGIIINRSTLVRNGVLVRSAWYDSGFEGRAMSPAQVWVPAKVEVGMRVAQLILWDAKPHKVYDGDYKGQGASF